MSLIVHAGLLTAGVTCLALRPADRPPSVLMTKGESAAVKVTLVRPEFRTVRPPKPLPPLEQVAEHAPVPAVAVAVPRPPEPPPPSEPPMDHLAMMSLPPEVDLAPAPPEPAQEPAPTAVLPEPSAERRRDAQPPKNVEPVPPTAAPVEPVPKPPALPAAPKPHPPAKPGVSRGVKILHLPTPRYPPSCRRRGQEGLVVLEVEVLADGSAGCITVCRHAEAPALDQAAVTGIRRAKFLPALRNGRPVAATILIPVRFELR